ncbi:hypothetical protein [Tsukamurella sp. 1534]|uniref:hypothetical protein n=1 Tax=Tsukamurella sp. 1534 TaxID=1151061 RepID=UPI00030277BF|nr:hypothetical protein [Tsukamurella sp. 1534]
MLLLAALGATVIGFVLLIVALMTANLWLAIACVVVSVIGVALLLGDVLTYRRGDRDSKLAGREAKRAAEKPWTPGGATADGGEAPEDRPAGKTADEPDEGGGKPSGNASAGLAGLTGGAALAGGAAAAGSRRGDEGDADAAREAGTVGHEEFGHHGDADRDPGQAPGQDWSHESAADTDQPAGDDRSTGLIFPGRYDPDMTDQIPQIEIERAWGSEWEPPEDPDKK